AVHADLAVVVDGHEREGRIDASVHDLEGDPVALGDAIPDRDGGTPEGVDAEPDARGADRVEIDRRGELGDVARREVLATRGALRSLEGDAADAVELRVEELVGALLDPPGRRGVGGPAGRRVVLE